MLGLAVAACGSSPPDSGVDAGSEVRFAGYVSMSRDSLESRFFDEVSRSERADDLSRFELFERHVHDVPGVAPGSCGVAPRPTVRSPLAASAGTMTIRNGAQVLGTFEPVHSPDVGDYYFELVTIPADATLDVELAGAAVPAVSLPMLARTPSPLVVSAPTPGQDIALAPASGVTATWTPPQTGRVTLVVADVFKTSGGMYERRETFCVPDTASGTFTIPASVFDAGATAEETEVSIEISQASEVVVGSARYLGVAQDAVRYLVRRQ